MRCTPCRVTMKTGPDAGQRFTIEADGQVRKFFPNTPNAAIAAEPEFIAKDVRAEAARQRRNRNARQRSDVMRSLGMVRTPFGWE